MAGAKWHATDVARAHTGDLRVDAAACKEKPYRRARGERARCVGAVVALSASKEGDPQNEHREVSQEEKQQ